MQSGVGGWGLGVVVMGEADGGGRWGRGYLNFAGHCVCTLISIVSFKMGWRLYRGYSSKEA